MIFAGFETCAATIPKIMWRIITNDGCQQRLQEELDTLEVGNLAKGLLSYDRLQELPYLSACINEGMRMDPVTGTNLPRQVPAAGVRLNGYDLPSGVSQPRAIVQIPTDDGRPRSERRHGFPATTRKSSKTRIPSSLNDT
jgi:cytochrome P450